MLCVELVSLDDVGIQEVGDAANLACAELCSLLESVSLRCRILN